MAITESLVTDSIALQRSVKGAPDVLEQIAALACANPLCHGTKESDLVRALREREALGSTGLGRGIAIPHCAIDGLDDFIVGLLTTVSPVDFQSMDGAPVNLFFFIIGPTEQRNRHIKLLSAISKVLSQSEKLSQLRASANPEAVRELLVTWLRADEEPKGSEKVLFQIFLQDFEVFEDVLNLLSSVVPGSISVLETRNAGAYLFSLPLFAAFWTEKASQDGRIILAIAERGMTNNLIRQIQEITGDPQKRDGVVLTVQNLSYAAGSLSF